MKTWIVTLYNGSCDGHVQTVQMETKEEVIKQIEKIMGCKYESNEYGEYLVLDYVDPDYELDFEECEDCWQIAIGECNESGFAHDAVQW